MGRALAVLGQAYSWRAKNLRLARWPGCTLSKGLDRRIDPPSPRGAHSILYANLPEYLICSISPGWIKMSKPDQLIEHVMNKRTPHEIRGVNRGATRPVPGVAV